MPEFPALPLWTDALIVDTLELTDAEFGCYVLMLILAWRRADCALPADSKIIKRMVQGCCNVHGNHLNKTIPKILAKYWVEIDGKYTQKRLTKERDFLRKKSENNAENANIRWNNNDLKMRPQCERNAPTPTPTPTPIKKEKNYENGTRQDSQQAKSSIRPGFLAWPEQEEFKRWTDWASKHNRPLWRELQARELQGRRFDFETQWPPDS